MKFLRVSRAIELQHEAQATCAMGRIIIRNRGHILLSCAGLSEIAQMPFLRATLAESLRLYPQPPILIRRALDDDVLPAGLVRML